MPKQFYKQLFIFLDDHKIDYKIDSNIVRFKQYPFSFFLVLENHHDSIPTITNYREVEKNKYDKFLIFIWFDLWYTKKEVILSKITHLFGLSHKIHARKTKVISVGKDDCHTFFLTNHLNKPVIGYKRIGLELDGELIALGSFAKRRKFRDDTYSAELLQFATKNGFHINGGLSKIIKGFTKIHTIDSLMTYVDLDWSEGHKFKNIGFDFISQKENIYFTTHHQFREFSNEPTNIFSLGAKKYSLKINNNTD